jgi:5-methylcytosine-specific restriction endonuclease McrA
MFPLKIITWQGAVKMKYEGTVDVLAEYDDEICSPSVTWQTPAVIRLRKNTTSKKHRVRFSRINIYTRDNFTCQYCAWLQIIKFLPLVYVGCS